MDAKRNGMKGALLALAGLLVVGAPQLLQSAQPRAEEELEQVTVEGVSITRMRMELVAMEERFYALYNQLNKDNDFDVHCYSEAPLGTHIKHRVCRVAYVEEAQMDFAQAFVEGIRNGLSMPAVNVPAPESVELSRQDEYRTNALKVINGDKRLLRLARQRIAAQERYEEELRKRSRSKRQSGSP